MNKLKTTILVFSLSLVVSGHWLFAAEINVDSRISEVTVYPDSALVSRVAALKLNAGEYEVLFADIIPDIDENSLRVSVAGGGAVKLFGARVKKEFLQEDAAERVKQIREELQRLEDEMRKFSDAQEVISQEKVFLNSIQLFSGEQIPKDLITRMPVAKDLEDTFKFLDTKFKEGNAQNMDIEMQVRETRKKIDVLNRELSEISCSSRKLKRSIVVDLGLVKPEVFDLKVSYLVRGASWQPIYDARAGFEKSQVELVSYGIVRQKTGEDWSDVEMSLSTAKPAIGGNMPYVAPWVLRPYQPPRIMEKRAYSVGIAHQKMAFDAVKEETLATGEGKEAEEQYAEVEEKGIAVLYKLAKKATVKSDATEHKLPVSSQTLAAKFEYSSYPRAVLNAYLGSRVTNAPNLQLLAGRVNIFLEGDFVGASAIDNIGPGEEFDLYLGADENVKVKREQIEKKVDETLVAGIPASTKRTTLKYKLTVENYKSRKINVKLFEAMPVPEDDRIKVKIANVSLEPKQKDWKDRKGVWLWELELEPKAKREIVYTYIIEHPREMQVEGL